VPLPAPGGAIISTRILISSPHHLARCPPGRYPDRLRGGETRTSYGPSGTQAVCSAQISPARRTACDPIGAVPPVSRRGCCLPRLAPRRRMPD